MTRDFLPKMLSNFKFLTRLIRHIIQAHFSAFSNMNFYNAFLLYTLDLTVNTNRSMRTFGCIVPFKEATKLRFILNSLLVNNEKYSVTFIISATKIQGP
jgi:hypothetical protein